MKVLHITPKTNGYEEVELLANKWDKHNGLAAIRREDGVNMTGGFLLEDNHYNRSLLDSIPRENQYEIVKSMRATPFVKEFYQDK